LDALGDRERHLDGGTWLETLVPFVASLFVRTAYFKTQFESRFPGLTGPAAGVDAAGEADRWHDNTLQGAQLEWQRLLAPTMAARWIVLHGSGAPILATNDTARCVTSNPTTGEVAYGIPLDVCKVLLVARQETRRILDWDGRRWMAVVQHEDVSDERLLGCRRAIQLAAFMEVYGPTRESVGAHRDIETYPSGAEYLATTGGPGLIPYEHDYLRALTLLQMTPKEVARYDGHFDWPAIARVYGGVVIFPVNLPRFPGGIVGAPRSMYLDITRFSPDDVTNAANKPGQPPPEPKFSPVLRELLARDYGVNLGGGVPGIQAEDDDGGVW
jgi:hypothetical protein